MSRFPPERSPRLCDDARRLLERTTEHGELVDALVTAVERTAATTISARYCESPATIDEQLHALDDCARRNVQAARQLLVSARQQHAAAAELLKDLDSGDRLVPTPMTVLVVDDQSAVRDVVAQVLRNAGFIVTTAADGLEAVVAAHASRPNVIVMDIQMPVPNGIEATRLIKAREATRHARVIACTGDSSLDAGASEFAAVLRKPALPDELLASVQFATRV